MTKKRKQLPFYILLLVALVILAFYTMLFPENRQLQTILTLGLFGVCGGLVASRNRIRHKSQETLRQLNAISDPDQRLAAIQATQRTAKVTIDDGLYHVLYSYAYFQKGEKEKTLAHTEEAVEAFRKTRSIQEYYHSRSVYVQYLLAFRDFAQAREELNLLAQDLAKENPKKTGTDLRGIDAQLAIAEQNRERISDYISFFENTDPTWTELLRAALDVFAHRFEDAIEKLEYVRENTTSGTYLDLWVDYLEELLPEHTKAKPAPVDAE